MSFPWARACAVAWLLCGCTRDEVTVGSQCPTPASGHATLANPDAGGSIEYGYSCAPCDGDEPQLDAHGCPVLVTRESCGGDICIGRVRVPPLFPDAGVDEDAGSDADGGEDDGGAEATP